MRHLILAAALALACTGGSTEPTTQAPPPGPTLKHDKGVDPATKTVRIGTLNDESGPGAAIGKPYAVGKRVLAAAVNAGEIAALPPGWKVELVERDHGYNPQASVQAFREVEPDVLLIGTSFGTPNTMPLRPQLEATGTVAFPASLSSEMANHKHTPPLGPSYQLEARRAVDWVLTTTPDATTLKLGIVYQQDDYGKDGLAGWKMAAESKGLALVSEQSVAPGQKDMAAVITSLKDAGATHVLLSVLPSATGPIVGTAAQLGYAPTWIGNTPAWIDRFFDPEVIPSAVFGNYVQINGLPFWGEPVPGMDSFLAAYEKHGKELANPDFYILVSYLQGLAQLEAAKRAIEGGDITRAGYLQALTSIDGWNAGGMMQPVSFTTFPYVTGTRTRVLRPDFEKRTWTVVADYADPS